MNENKDYETMTAEEKRDTLWNFETRAHQVADQRKRMKEEVPAGTNAAEYLDGLQQAGLELRELKKEIRRLVTGRAK